MEPVITGRGLAQRYRRRWVFQSLDIDVRPGTTALLGPNGTGKTTLLHTLVGLRPPVAGTLRVLGYNGLRRDGRRTVAARLGFLPQQVGYYPGFTVRDFVGYAAWLKGVPSRQIRERVNAALERVRLEDQASSRMRALSGGTLRRAALALAIVAEPELLVMDEPSAGLDPEQRIELRKLTRRLGGCGSVLLSTHLVEDVRHVADRVLVLHQGRIAFAGSASELAAVGDEDAAGDTDLERGYLAVLRREKRVRR